MSKITHAVQKLGFFISLLFASHLLQAQALGGNAVFNFVTLPYTAKATALGGINISALGNDLGLAMYNPALLDPEMDRSIQLSIKPYYASVHQYDLSGAKMHPNKNIVFGWGLHYMDYGTINMTDNAANSMGTLRPVDYALQWGAATTYKKQFHIGANIKFIQSNYGLYKSNGVAMDVGLSYIPYSGLSQASILVNNMGVQLRKYGTNREDLPFNIIAGYSKKLENAPFQFAITAQRLSVWNTSYNDTSLNIAEGQSSPSTMRNLFNHLILSSQLYIGSQLTVDLGYNFLRRYDLNLQNQVNGLNGFSSGLTVRINNTQVQYANAFFQNNVNHHCTIVYTFNKKGLTSFRR
jgi:hypothetical protein